MSEVLLGREAHGGTEQLLSPWRGRERREGASADPPHTPHTKPGDRLAQRGEGVGPTCSGQRELPKAACGPKNLGRRLRWRTLGRRTGRRGGPIWGLEHKRRLRPSDASFRTPVNWPS